MKKIFTVLFLCAILIGCVKGYDLEPKPIEKYKNKGYVIHRIQPYYHTPDDCLILGVKTSDTILLIKVLKFDAENLKIGDTIR